MAAAKIEQNLKKELHLKWINSKVSNRNWDSLARRPPSGVGQRLQRLDFETINLNFKFWQVALEGSVWLKMLSFWSLLSGSSNLDANAFRWPVRNRLDKRLARVDRLAIIDWVVSKLDDPIEKLSIRNYQKIRKLVCLVAAVLPWRMLKILQGRFNRWVFVQHCSNLENVFWTL